LAVGRLGHRIPDAKGVNGTIERERATVPDLMRTKLANERAHDTAADQQTPVAGDQVYVDVRPWQEAHLPFCQQSNIRHVQDSQLAASSQANL
jgi:hypothetical protein